MRADPYTLAGVSRGKVVDPRYERWNVKSA